MWAALALPAHAEGTASLAEAQRLSAAGEVEQALAMLDQVLAVRPDDAPALQLRAKVLLDSRDWGAALAAYEAYLKVAPSGANKRSALAIVKNLEPVRTTSFELTVSSASADAPAAVYLDSKSLGVFCQAAPTCSRNVLPGAHRLIIDTEGFDKDTSEVTFVLGQSVKVTRTLKEKPSALTLTSSHDGAQVTLDGAPLGVAPLTRDVAAGEHQVELSLAGYLPTTRTFTARRGAPVALAVTLDRGLPITGGVDGATYQVDGVTVELRDGLVPVPADGQPHTIQISAPGRLASTVEVPAQVESGFTIDGKLRLEKIELRFTGRAGGTVKIDGEAIGKLPLAEPWRGAPGEHTIEVTAGGARPYRHQGTFEADHDVDVDVAAASGGRTKLWIAAGATGAALITGVTFGVLALGKEDAYAERARTPGITPADTNLRNIAATGDSWALISDISLGAAIVGAGVTTWFLLTGKKATAGEVRVHLSPTGGSVARSF